MASEGGGVTGKANHPSLKKPKVRTLAKLRYISNSKKNIPFVNE